MLSSAGSNGAGHQLFVLLLAAILVAVAAAAKGHGNWNHGNHGGHHNHHHHHHHGQQQGGGGGGQGGDNDEPAIVSAFKKKLAQSLRKNGINANLEKSEMRLVQKPGHPNDYIVCYKFNGSADGKGKDSSGMTEYSGGAMVRTKYCPKNGRIDVVYPECTTTAKAMGKNGKGKKGKGQKRSLVLGKKNCKPSQNDHSDQCKDKSPKQQQNQKQNPKEDQNKNQKDEPKDQDKEGQQDQNNDGQRAQDGQ